MSDRGHTDKLADRLIRFEIRELVPDVTVAWHPDRDVAKFSYHESATTFEDELVAGDYTTIRMYNKSRDQDQEDRSEQIQVEASLQKKGIQRY